MTENDVLKSLKICSEWETCEECSCKEEGKGICKQCLMKAAYNVIKFQHEQIVQAGEAIDKLTKDSDNLYRMVNRKYTDEQLVKAVNEIIDSFEDEDDTDCKISTIGSFMRLCGLKGHIAVSPTADYIGIILDK